MNVGTAGRTARNALVIGAGIGGLCAAIRLARAGLDVTVVEKNRMPGGRCGRISSEGYHFDIGPTILLVPSVLEELFAHAGRSLRDYLQIEALSPNYNVHFPDGSRLLLQRDREAMGAELERFEPGAARKYAAYLDAGAAQMKAAMERFAVTHYDSISEFVSPGVARDLFRAGAYRTLAQHVRQFFNDPRLQQAFSFQTMYLGLSPYEAPAIYGLLPYTELADGVFYAKGGLYAVPLALEKLARELGVKFEYGRSVSKLVPEGDRIGRVQFADGDERTADLVLCNVDLPWAYRNLLPDYAPKRLQSMKYTSSGFMLYLGVDKQYAELLHHNVFFRGPFRQSFDDIFGAKVIPNAPSYYVAAPTVSDPSQAPQGCSSLYVLVPVPHQSDRVDWSRAEEPLRNRILDDLEATAAPGLRKHIVVEERINPNDWASRFSLEKGSAFGLSHVLTQVGPFRPKNHDPRLKNLYFCGASTQPGTGIPLVAISAQLAVDRMLREHHISARPRGPARTLYRESQATP